MINYPPAIVPSTAQLREFERLWIQKCDTQWGLVLMEQAGSRAAQVVHNLWRQAPGLVAVICGTGNNGGDGLVVARYLRNRSVPVAVFYIESTEARSWSEATVNLSVAGSAGVPLNKMNANDLSSLHEALKAASVIVDALLGTGLDRPVEGLYRQLVEMVNQSGRPVVAMDVPSGINSDTGQVMGTAIRAAATVTFGYLKPGLIAYPAADLCGHLCVADIGFPPIESQLSAPHTVLSTIELMRVALPPRYADSHKGSYGTVLAVAGSAAMSGAAELCSVGALRAGAGLSILASVEPVVRRLNAPEVIRYQLSSTDAGTISKKAQAQIETAVESSDSIVIGPGLSLNEETVQLVQEIVKGVKKPCVVDGDALTAVSKNPACVPAAAAAQLVLTPHPGEMSRLLGADIRNIQSDRYRAVRAAAEKFGCTVVLKGSRTLIANAAGDVFVNSTGNSGMSTAGSGDVLSGIIAGFMAQGMEGYEAAVLGAYVHGTAGDVAAFNLGDVGILAGDIGNCVPAAINKIRTGEYPGSMLEIQLATEPFVVPPRPR